MHALPLQSGLLGQLININEGYKNYIQVKDHVFKTTLGDLKYTGYAYKDPNEGIIAPNSEEKLQNQGIDKILYQANKWACSYAKSDNDVETLFLPVGQGIQEIYTAGDQLVEKHIGEWGPKDPANPNGEWGFFVEGRSALGRLRKKQKT